MCVYVCECCHLTGSVFLLGVLLVLQDQLYDDFLKNGKFRGEGTVVPRRLTDLLMWSFWAVVTCVPLFYYVTILFLSGTFEQQLIFLGCVAVCECVVQSPSAAFEMVVISPTKHLIHTFMYFETKSLMCECYLSVRQMCCERAS